MHSFVREHVLAVQGFRHILSSTASTHRFRELPSAISIDPGVRSQTCPSATGRGRKHRNESQKGPMCTNEAYKAPSPETLSLESSKRTSGTGAIVNAQIKKDPAAPELPVVPNFVGFTH